MASLHLGLLVTYVVLVVVWLSQTLVVRSPRIFKSVVRMFLPSRRHAVGCVLLMLSLSVAAAMGALAGTRPGIPQALGGVFMHSLDIS